MVSLTNLISTMETSATSPILCLDNIFFNKNVIKIPIMVLIIIDIFSFNLNSPVNIE